MAIGSIQLFFKRIGVAINMGFALLVSLVVATIAGIIGWIMGLYLFGRGWGELGALVALPVFILVLRWNMRRVRRHHEAGLFWVWGDDDDSGGDCD